MRCVLPPEQLNHVLPETFWNEHVLMFLAGWRHLRRRRSVTDQHQRLLESGISSALALFETFPRRPIELALELTDCCARARDFGTTVCECFAF